VLKEKIQASNQRATDERGLIEIAPAVKTGAHPSVLPS
jgi:hypothetical protein